MNHPTLRGAAAEVGAPFFAVDVPASRSVSGGGNSGEEKRLTLRFDLELGGRIAIETIKNPRSMGDSWSRFSHRALMKWGMVHRLTVPQQVQLETRVISIPVDGFRSEMYFLGDTSQWVVGGDVDQRSVSIVGSAVDIAAIALVTISDLSEYRFLDEARS